MNESCTVTKRKACEFEDIRNSYKKSLGQKEYDLDDNISLEELDLLLEKAEKKLAEIGEVEIDFSSINDIFKIVTEKTGITKQDKNSADIVLVERNYECISNKAKEIMQEKEKMFKQYELASQDYKNKVKKAEISLKNAEEQLELSKNTEKNIISCISEYQKVLKEMGVFADLNEDCCNISTSNNSIVIENASSNSYVLKIDDMESAKKETVIYPSELSGFFYKLLLKSDV